MRSLSLTIIFLIIAFLIGSMFVGYSQRENAPPESNDPRFATFQRLSSQGNSSCSASFRESIITMADTARLQGSCCSQMSWHRYQEQTEGLKKYSHISEIPQDPYDIDAKLAKNLLTHYEDQLTIEQQKAYDFAMANSDEKGPCCCKCWRWHVYGGLGKLLIQQYNFTGEQLTEVWNLSDGCGGEGDHVHHAS